MKVTTHDQAHERQAIFGLMIFLVTALGASLLLWAKIHYMM
jgi:hypothetical protein